MNMNMSLLPTQRNTYCSHDDQSCDGVLALHVNLPPPLPQMLNMHQHHATRCQYPTGYSGSRAHPNTYSELATAPPQPPTPPGEASTRSHTHTHTRKFKFAHKWNITAHIHRAGANRTDILNLRGQPPQIHDKKVLIKNSPCFFFLSYYR